MKKIFINIKVFAILAALLISTGCEKTLDINTDPNNPGIENATPEVLFPAGVMSTAGMVGGQLAIVGNLWSQYVAQNSSSSQYRSVDSYNLINSSEEVNLSYQELYSGALNDYQLTITKAQENEDWRYNLMATVMKAYTYEVLVDLYDQVPYTEALKGQEILQPKFDDGYSIYQSLLAEIDEALSKDFKSNPLSAAQQSTDFVFAGDMDKWEQFANTLKLKMYLRMVNAKPAEAQAGIQALYNANATFLSDNAGVDVFTDVPEKRNPMYEFNIEGVGTTSNLKASITFISWLKANNDPRIVDYFGTATPTGMHQGDFAASLVEQPTYPNATTFVQHADDPVWFISAAESYFMQAEALERYYNGAKDGVTGKQMYDAGVTAAFAELDLTPGNLLTTNYAYPVNGSLDAKIEAIIVQKWAAFPRSHALEAFFEKNRTGYPRTSPVPSTNEAQYVPGQLVYSFGGVTGAGNFPQRFVFPDYERSRNKNTPPEVPITTKVWWAK
ncbi:SusD/RagB family nutrient-binding outer membrane lipoprotein [Rubrolithibacter danxiaensis]|uniref:SusD/RagB family nutrient-binding outer membrane lipoprotein n=1 Tax=Rubrolithibacter danxiaensis TaxID=3390805 RepID=UPI003BF9234F